jgi:hypothetical protein
MHVWKHVRMDEQIILVAGTIRLHTRKLRTGVLDRVHVCILAMHERAGVRFTCASVRC